MFEVLRTCIVGESFRACGIGYHPEDGLEMYHVSEFHDNVDADDITGFFSSPDDFLESLCSTNAGRVYEAVREMERCWKSNTAGQPAAINNTMKRLWILGNPEALEYIDDNFGQEAAQDFLEYGCFVFGDVC